MLTRYFLIFSLLFVVTACSSTDDAALTDDVFVGEREVITTTAESVPVYGEGLAAANAGTQEDLVVNVGDRVFFGYDSYALTSGGRETLNGQARWLQQYPALSVTVEGHADERGTREYNLALGDRRANAVKEYLVALGVNTSRMNVISYGKERPAVAGANDAAWAQNRRGVTIVE